MAKDVVRGVVDVVAGDPGGPSLSLVKPLQLNARGRPSKPRDLPQFV